MSEQNAALIKKGYDAFSSGDMDTLREIFAPNIVWHVTGRSPIAGDYKGVDEVFDFFGKLFAATNNTFKLDVHDTLASDKHVVVLAHTNASNNGKTLDQNVVHIWHVDDGKATEFWVYDEDMYAGDEFFA